MRGAAARPPQAQRLRAPLERHRPHQPDHADHVVGVEVREEDVGERERDAVAHHLPLRALAAVEQQRLALAHDGERGDVAFDGGARGGGAEETEGERHGGAI